MYRPPLHPLQLKLPAPAPTEEAAAIVDKPNVLDTIIVRARKRDESIFDIPGVVNVLSADQLRANGTTDAQSLALNNLGVVYSVTFAGSSAPRITIRGVGDDDFNPKDLRLQRFMSMVCTKAQMAS